MLAAGYQSRNPGKADHLIYLEADLEMMLSAPFGSFSTIFYPNVFIGRYLELYIYRGRGFTEDFPTNFNGEIFTIPLHDAEAPPMIGCEVRTHCALYARNVLL